MVSVPLSSSLAMPSGRLKPLQTLTSQSAALHATVRSVSTSHKLSMESVPWSLPFWDHTSSSLSMTKGRCKMYNGSTSPSPFSFGALRSSFGYPTFRKSLMQTWNFKLRRRMPRLLISHSLSNTGSSMPHLLSSATLGHKLESPGLFCISGVSCSC